MSDLNLGEILVGDKGLGLGVGRIWVPVRFLAIRDLCFGVNGGFSLVCVCGCV
jgi:hypothetical protein